MFHKNDQPKITIKLQNVLIQSKKEIIVLGFTFDCKLNWNTHIANSISKAKKALFALRLICKCFNRDEMRTLLDSNCYSILYYNAVSWLTPEISCVMKQALLSVSANALRSCMLYNCPEISFERIRSICNKCTPKQITLYQIFLKLHKTIYELDMNMLPSLMKLLSIQGDRPPLIFLNIIEAKLA